MGILLLGYLIYLIYEYNTRFGLVDIIVCGREKLRDDRFDIVTYVSRFRKACRIGDRERNIQKLRKSFDKIGLTAAGRSDQQDI